MQKSSAYSFLKKHYSRRKAMVGIAGATSAYLWARYLEPELLDITRHEIILHDWPKALDGFRIAQLTDLHFDTGVENSLMEKVLEALGHEQPDLITLTGDYVTHDSKSLNELCQSYLKKLSAPHGIYASPGNHDVWYCSPSLLRHEFEKAGIGYLENQGTTINIKGERIFLSGLDSAWGGKPDGRLAWKGYRTGDPVIAMIHEPDLFDEIPANHHVSLQLSGHTHGGQCRVPLIGYAPVKVKYGRNYIYGDFEKNGSKLWVGRGLGTAGLRVRFACQPELVILTLRSA